MIVRRMTINDIDQMIALGKQMHEESNFAPRDWSNEKLWELGWNIVHNPNSWFGAVAEHDDKIIGMFIGYMTEFYFGKDQVAQDYLLYVEPNRRGTVAAVGLIGQFELWAWNNGATEIRPSTSTGIEIDRICQFYQRMGYEITGYNFRKTK